MTQPYQSRKQIHRKKKKNWLPLLPVCILFLAGGTYVINKMLVDLNPRQEKAHASSSSKKSEKEQAKESLLTQLSNEKWTKSESYSTSEQTFFIDDLKNEENLGLLFSHFPKENAPEIVTGKEVSEDYSEALKRVYYDFSSYTWNETKKIYDKTESNSGETSFMKADTHELPKITDFFPSKTELMHSHFLIQQEILNSSQDGNKIIDEVLNQQPFTPEELTVNKVNDVGIQVNLTKPIGDVSSFTLPWAEFAYYLNPKYVSTQYFPKKETKQVALTFDDGPSPETTERLLDILKEENVKATFFVLGNAAQANPSILEKIISEGHIIGNHSYDHAKLTQLSPEAIKKEMQDTDKIVYQTTGQLPKYIRPPYGAMKESIAKTLNQPLIHWNIDTEDWKKGSPEDIVGAVNENLENGSVILLHDIHKTSVDSVQPLIQSLKKQGYTFTSINSLFEGPHRGTQYFGGSREINVFQ